MKNITTGVDKLVNLLGEKKKITLSSAANILNISADVVQDWAEFLEKEGLITVSSKFSKVWLEQKEITKQKVELSVKEMSSERDALSRKIEAAIKSLDKSSAGFEDIKKEFIKIQSHVKTELDTVRREMGELEKFEKLRSNIDKDISKQKKDYSDFISQLESDINKFQKDLNVISNSIKAEEEKAELSLKNIGQLNKNKEKIQSDINNSLKELSSLTSKFDAELKELEKSEGNVQKFRSEFEKILQEINNKKDVSLENFSKKLNEEKSRMNKQHDELLNSANSKLSTIQRTASSGKSIYNDFLSKFDDKIKTIDYIDSISSEKLALRKDLENLHKRVVLFSVMRKQPGISNQLDEIEADLIKYEKRHSTLMGKIESMINFIKR